MSGEGHAVAGPPPSRLDNMTASLAGVTASGQTTQPASNPWASAGPCAPKPAMADSNTNAGERPSDRSQDRWVELDKPLYAAYSTAFVFALDSMFFPLDLLKTRQQHSRSSTPMSMRTLLSSILRQEGVAGLFRGFLPAAFGNLPGQMAYFATYEYSRHLAISAWTGESRNFSLKQAVLDALDDDDEDEDGDDATGNKIPPGTAWNQSIESDMDTTTQTQPRGPGQTALFGINMVCGFLADATCLLVYTPADVVSQRLMVAKPPETKNADLLHQKGQKKGLLSSIRNIFIRQGRSPINFHHEVWHPPVERPTSSTIVRETLRSEGLRGLYRGYFGSVMTYAPTSAVWFAVYELGKDAMLARRQLVERVCGSSIGQDSQAWKSGVHAVAGASAGFWSTLLLNPLDVARTRIQTMNIRNEEDARIIRRGFFYALHFTAKTEGIRGLMRGLIPRLWMSVPGSALTFAGYELAKQLATKPGVQRSDE